MTKKLSGVVKPPKKNDGKARRQITLPVELNEECKVKCGDVSALIENLLKDHFEKEANQDARVEGVYKDIAKALHYTPDELFNFIKKRLVKQWEEGDLFRNHLTATRNAHGAPKIVFDY